MESTYIFTVSLLWSIAVLSRVILSLGPRKWILNTKSDSFTILNQFKGRIPHKKWLNKFGLLLFYSVYLGSIMGLAVLVWALDT